jgi:hypothetical protein
VSKGRRGVAHYGALIRRPAETFRIGSSRAHAARTKPALCVTPPTLASDLLAVSCHRQASRYATTTDFHVVAKLQLRAPSTSYRQHDGLLEYQQPEHVIRRDNTARQYRQHCSYAARQKQREKVQRLASKTGSPSTQRLLLLRRATCTFLHRSRKS